jgi:hypothetical protein
MTALTLALACCSAHAIAGATAILHVDDNAPAGGDGASWSSALRFLGEALSIADGGGVSEIRIAQGLYRPDESAAAPAGTGNRDASFALVPGVTLRGGFAGLAAGPGQSPDDHDVTAFVTVLSGDLLGNDAPGFVGYGDNSRHVISMSSLAAAATLDGLTVRGGNADLAGDLLLGGGGLIANPGHVVIDNCTFTQNSVGLGFPTLGNFGGGAFVKTGGSLTINNSTFVDNRSNNGGAVGGLGPGVAISLTDSTFLDNHADDQVGGALYCAQGQLTIDGCTFQDNEADYGGALFSVLTAPIVIRDSTFTANNAPVRGGAIWFDRCDELDSIPLAIDRCSFVNNESTGFGGAMQIDETVSHFTDCAFLGNTSFRISPVTGLPEGGAGAVLIQFELGHAFRNCLFAHNHAADIGGLWVFGGSVELINTTIAHNTALFAQGVGLFVDDSSLLAANSILWGNGAAGPGTESSEILFDDPPSISINFCTIEGLVTAFGGIGNNDADPVFDDVDGTDDTPGTIDDDFALQPGSPAIDSGDNEAVPVDIAADLLGNPRFVDDPATIDDGAGMAPIVDRGPLEFQVKTINPADLDGDCDVDGFDLALLLAAWGRCPARGACPPDLDGNGVVDGFDLATLLAAWGPC